MEYKPHPDYITHTGKAPKPKSRLWFDRFTHKVSIKGNDRESASKCIDWCSKNTNHNFKMSGGHSFFFLSITDAMAFRLTFSDKIAKVESIDSIDAIELLKQRIIDAQNDLDIFNEDMEDNND